MVEGISPLSLRLLRIRIVAMAKSFVGARYLKALIVPHLSSEASAVKATIKFDRSRSLED